jgi:hypothetical protein
MSSATLALVVLVTVVLIAGLIIRFLRPRRREGPASENSAWFSANGIGPSSYHDAGSHRLPIDAPSHSGIDTGSHGGVDSAGHGGSAP